VPGDDVDYYAFTAHAGDHVHAAVVTAESFADDTDSVLSSSGPTSRR
jgi:hypothetical protein